MCNPSFAKNNIHDGSIDQQDIYAKTYKVYIYIYIYLSIYFFRSISRTFRNYEPTQLIKQFHFLPFFRTNRKVYLDVHIINVTSKFKQIAAVKYFHVEYAMMKRVIIPSFGK